MNLSNCCKVKLSRKTRDDWAVGKTEHWDVDRFDDCGETLFKVRICNCSQSSKFLVEAKRLLTVQIAMNSPQNG